MTYLESTQTILCTQSVPPVSSFVTMLELMYNKMVSLVIMTIHVAYMYENTDICSCVLGRNDDTIALVVWDLDCGSTRIQLTPHKGYYLTAFFVSPTLESVSTMDEYEMEYYLYFNEPEYLYGFWIDDTSLPYRCETGIGELKEGLPDVDVDKLNHACLQCTPYQTDYDRCKDSLFLHGVEYLRIENDDNIKYLDVEAISPTSIILEYGDVR